MNKNNSTWGNIVVKSNFFVRFLGELKIPNRHFKINWRFSIKNLNDGDVQSGTHANTSPANKGKLTQVKFVSTPLIVAALSRELINIRQPMNQKTIVLFQNTIVMIFCPIMSFQWKLFESQNWWHYMLPVALKV